jgi:hypothetical protein
MNMCVSRISNGYLLSYWETSAPGSTTLCGRMEPTKRYFASWEDLCCWLINHQGEIDL